VRGYNFQIKGWKFITKIEYTIINKDFLHQKLDRTTNWSSKNHVDTYWTARPR